MFLQQSSLWWITSGYDFVRNVFHVCLQDNKIVGFLGCHQHTHTHTHTHILHNLDQPQRVLRGITSKGFLIIEHAENHPFLFTEYCHTNFFRLFRFIYLLVNVVTKLYVYFYHNYNCIFYQLMCSSVVSRKPHILILILGCCFLGNNLWWTWIRQQW